MTTNIAPETSSAAPVSADDGRWRPVRAGLLNVWQYTDEVLEFERGRLVLYGPNGSGKTMALELLLPHLLDASAMPGRLSTSGADRGGLWDRVCGYDENEPRTGYLWLEFASDSGSSFTTGVRLRAKPSGGGDKHWFTTSRRIGIDFSLLDDHRRPLSVEQLTECVESAGKVWGPDTTGYRQALRAVLFPGWSQERLDALIRTLLVVRKQNVTEGLSPMRLSELLSEALPPLDESELGRVADGFADLDRRRDHISQLEADIASTRRLADANRTYARAFVARLVGDVVAATTAFDNVARDVRSLQNQLEVSSRRVAELAAREEALELEDQELSGRLDGLKSSDAYKQGAALENLRQTAEAARQRAEEAERDVSHARSQAQQRRDRATRAQENRALTARQLGRARQELEAVGAELGAEMLKDVADESLVSVTNAWIEGRERAMQEVRVRLSALELAVQLRNRAQQHQSRSEAQLSSAEEAFHVATRAAEAAMKRWRDSVATWRLDARELSEYLVALDDPRTARALVTEAGSRAREPLISQRSNLQRKCAELDSELLDLRRELDAWLAGKEPEPDVPPGRRERTALSGAPFWRIVQFRGNVEDQLRGNVESALADARLLDAWVDADGDVCLPEGDSDILLLNPRPGRLTGDESLASLLEADPAANALTGMTIDRILASIALVRGDAHLAPATEQDLLIGTDGTWRTPRLAGRATLGPARYIGASSREATRQARILALKQDIATREEEQHALEAEHEVIEERLRRCDDEVRRFPSTAEVQDADQEVDRNRVRIELARDSLFQANVELETANENVKLKQHELHRVASAHQLPTEGQRLEELQQRLSGVRNRAFAFQECMERFSSAKRDAAHADDAATDAEAEAQRRLGVSQTRHREHAEAAARFAAVETSVGADYREVLERIRTAMVQRAEIHAEQKQVRADHTRAAEGKASFGVELKQAETRRAEADAQRTKAGESFVAACRDDLIGDAEIDGAPPSDGLATTTAILDAARRLRSAGVLPVSPDDADVTRMSNTVMARINDASKQLSGRVDLTFETTDRGWSLLRARREGIVSSALSLLSGLRDDLDAARAELSQKQQELFEQILSGSVREHLKERLWGAQALVDRINGLLGQIRTEAGGVMVTIKWEINPDQSDAVELRQAKDLLLHDSPVAHGRAELDAFLRARIERVRAAEDDTGEWRSRLSRTLDYRSWHRFRILVHHNRFGEKPRALDSKKVSLSTGEKTIVMVLPLLAAVTAHYEPSRGEPPCMSPRLLLMDELFPKLDFPNKRKLMGLLPKLKMDAVFTSDKDRCEYDTLDGIAIHVFQKLGNDKTTTTRLVWNGRETRMAPVTAGVADKPEEVATLTQVKG